MEKRPRTVLPKAPAPEKTVLTGALDMIQKIVPENAAKKTSQPRTDDVAWVKMGVCPRPTGEEELYLILAYANGGQVWQLHDHNVAEECLSFRGGRLLCAAIIPFIASSRTTDLFHGLRPLLAFCTSNQKSRNTSIVQFRSLLQKKTQQHTIEVTGTPLAMTANASSLVILMYGEVVVFDTTNGVTKKLSFDDVAPIPRFANAGALLALGTRWLAFPTMSRTLRFPFSRQGSFSNASTPASSTNTTAASPSHTITGGPSSQEHNPHHRHQKGGVIETAPSMTGTGSGTSHVKSQQQTHQKDTMQAMYSIAQTTGATLRHIGDQGYKTMTEIVSGRRKTVAQSHHAVESADPSLEGYIAVCDTRAQRKEASQLCHIHAHSGPISALAFSRCGTLLATADVDGQNIHVYLLEPGTEATASLLFVLQRGFTHAVINDIAFSRDSRWVSVASQRGTVHLFPIHPTGAEVSVQTHATEAIPNVSQFLLSSGAGKLARSQHPQTIKAMLRIRCEAADVDKTRRVLQDGSSPASHLPSHPPADAETLTGGAVVCVHFRPLRGDAMSSHLCGDSSSAHRQEHCARNDLLVFTNEGKAVEFAMVVGQKNRERSYESWGSSVNKTAQAWYGQIVGGVSSYFSGPSQSSSPSSTSPQHPQQQQQQLQGFSNSSSPSSLSGSPGIHLSVGHARGKKSGSGLQNDANPLRVQEQQLVVETRAVNEWTVCREEQWADTQSQAAPSSDSLELGSTSSHESSLSEPHSTTTASTATVAANSTSAERTPTRATFQADASQQGAVLTMLNTVTDDADASLATPTATEFDDDDFGLDASDDAMAQSMFQAGRWLGEVEMQTHAPPHRRLWAGPQFSYHVYSRHGHEAKSPTAGDGTVQRKQAQETKRSQHSDRREKVSLHMAVNNITTQPLLSHLSRPQSQSSAVSATQADIDELTLAMRDEDDDSDGNDEEHHFNDVYTPPSTIPHYSEARSQQHQRQQRQQRPFQRYEGGKHPQHSQRSHQPQPRYDSTRIQHQEQEQQHYYYTSNKYRATVHPTPVTTMPQPPTRDDNGNGNGNQAPHHDDDFADFDFTSDIHVPPMYHPHGLSQRKEADKEALKKKTTTAVGEGEAAEAEDVDAPHTIAISRSRAHKHEEPAQVKVPAAKGRKAEFDLDEDDEDFGLVLNIRTDNDDGDNDQDQHQAASKTPSVQRGEDDGDEDEVETSVSEHISHHGTSTASHSFSTSASSPPPSMPPTTSSRGGAEDGSENRRGHSSHGSASGRSGDESNGQGQGSGKKAGATDASRNASAMQSIEREVAQDTKHGNVGPSVVIENDDGDADADADDGAGNTDDDVVQRIARLQRELQELEESDVSKLNKKQRKNLRKKQKKRRQALRDAEQALQHDGSNTFSRKHGSKEVAQHLLGERVLLNYDEDNDGSTWSDLSSSQGSTNSLSPPYFNATSNGPSPLSSNAASLGSHATAFHPSALSSLSNEVSEHTLGDGVSKDKSANKKDNNNKKKKDKKKTSKDVSNAGTGEAAARADSLGKRVNSSSSKDLRGLAAILDSDDDSGDDGEAGDGFPRVYSNVSL